MRILHILDHSLPKHSGYVFRTMSIMHQQKAMGWNPVLYTTARHGNTDQFEELIEGWTIYRTPNDGSHLRLPAGLQYIQEMRLTKNRLKILIPEIKPDIIHAHSPVLNFFPANKVRGKIPIVYEVRAFWEDAAVDLGTTKAKSLRYRISRGLETRAFKKATAVTAICEGLKQDIIARGIAEDKVTLIPNAVDIKKFPLIAHKNETLAQSLKLQNKIVLGFIGSFYAYEGLLFLVKALPELIKMQPDIRLLLVGGGPDEEKLKQLTNDLNLTEHVIFTGRVPHDTVRDYYSLTDIMVYPRHSIRLTETVTPLKPLEAMAMGKLVLASDIGGHRELIQQNINGKLFEADNSESLVNVCNSLIENRDTWPAIITAGRSYVETERNWQKSVSNYVSVYNTCFRARS
ncbi:TIGR04063 family PEP-CTERM/XrtA system glycosyltransferase [Kordiimonas pumila]|uniref:TIGR04063 family PEP-CTERM/XrtA system glycosyltransferase n=1 Tax=Kordiimonas pumila TaxID=2161677 RepID=A0ABV7D8D0_9PROT|nr:TIGR04063 family PEP-CTERM/XrtA system glycosyltransferase [Kordiimonas pumila]